MEARRVAEKRGRMLRRHPAVSVFLGNPAGPLGGRGRPRAFSCAKFQVFFKRGIPSVQFTGAIWCYLESFALASPAGGATALRVGLVGPRFRRSVSQLLCATDSLSLRSSSGTRGTCRKPTYRVLPPRPSAVRQSSRPQTCNLGLRTGTTGSGSSCSLSFRQSSRCRDSLTNRAFPT
jgi:hypothetical protein